MSEEYIGKFVVREGHLIIVDAIMYVMGQGDNGIVSGLKVEFPADGVVYEGRFDTNFQHTCYDTVEELVAARPNCPYVLALLEYLT